MVHASAAKTSSKENAALSIVDHVKNLVKFQSLKGHTNLEFWCSPKQNKDMTAFGVKELRQVGFKVTTDLGDDGDTCHYISWLDATESTAKTMLDTAIEAAKRNITEKIDEAIAQSFLVGKTKNTFNLNDVEIAAFEKSGMQKEIENAGYRVSLKETWVGCLIYEISW